MQQSRQLDCARSTCRPTDRTVEHVACVHTNDGIETSNCMHPSFKVCNKIISICTDRDAFHRGRKAGYAVSLNAASTFNCCAGTKHEVLDKSSSAMRIAMNERPKPGLWGTPVPEFAVSFREEIDIPWTPAAPYPGCRRKLQKPARRRSTMRLSHEPPLIPGCAHGVFLTLVLPNFLTDRRLNASFRVFYTTVQKRRLFDLKTRIFPMQSELYVRKSNALN